MVRIVVGNDIFYLCNNLFMLNSLLFMSKMDKKY